MQRSRLNKWLLLPVLLLISFAGFTQQASERVLERVTIQKISTNNYRVHYQLDERAGVTYQSVVLSILRRRAGRIEEVFSGALHQSGFKPTGDGRYNYNWRTNNATVKAGDELQAKIVVTYQPPAVVKKTPGTGVNQAPKANAGAFMDVELPLRSPIVLNGSNSSDPDGRIVSTKWKQVSGPAKVTISASDSVRSFVSGNLTEGKYVFELMVRDDKGASATDRIIVTVKPPSVVRNPVVPPVVTLPPVTPTQVPAQDTVLTSVTEKKPSTLKLKGGPSNAIVSLLMPGVGHYFVSGNHHGKGRKPATFAITAAYAGSAAAAYYFKSKGDQQYKDYVNLSSYREYQRDASGNIIGIRGADRSKSANSLDQANASRQKALILAGVAAGILVTDVVLTYSKGRKNKMAWEAEKRAQTSLFISSDGTGLAAGLRIKF